MPLTDDLKAKHASLWEKMVTHPFIVEMGDGTLPVSVSPWLCCRK